MNGDLAARARAAGDAEGAVALLEEWATSRGLELYPHQVDAVLEIASGSHVVLATPTGSGKSLVALGAHLVALATGRTSWYVAPIKALVAEKFFELADVLGADAVGLATGDASVNRDAPVVCATAEVLANLALRDGRDADVGLVALDEFHYYGDPDRGWAWQTPLLRLPRAQHLLMSATLGDTTAVREDLTRRTGLPVALVDDAERPVPLDFRWMVASVPDAVTELLQERVSPVYVVHPSQAGAVEQAQALLSLGVLDKAGKERVREALDGARFARGFGQRLSTLLRAGIGVHHAGLLPRYRRLVERLAQQGVLPVVCGTDTLGVGVNLPVRTVLLTSLVKYDGRRERHLSAREFHQLAGRAGRAGYDTAGSVVAVAPEHVVENAKAEAKAADDPKKRKKLVRKKPPEGKPSWEEGTFDRLRAAAPERLVPHLQVTSGTLLQLLQGARAHAEADADGEPRDPVAEAREYLTDNHLPRDRQRDLVRRAVARYRSLLDAEVAQRVDRADVVGAHPDLPRTPSARPLAAPGRTARLTVDVGERLALDQALAPFALAVLDLLDRESPAYALDVVSLVEATLDDPRQVLAAQKDKARAEAVAAMKAEGVEYEERVERVAEVEHPQPLREQLEAALVDYARGAPWVRDERLSPKSVVREMYERAATFGEYVQQYQLMRVEGVLLRYLADAYRTLRRLVPADAVSEDLGDLVEWLGEVVRQTDSSLLDEWERLGAEAEVAAAADAVVGDPPAAAAAATGRDADGDEPAPPPVTRNERAFRVLVRNAAFRRVELLARRQFLALGQLDADAGWDADRWREAGLAFFADHESGLDAGPDARGPRLFDLDRAPEPEPERDDLPARRWRVRQTLADADSDHDWMLTLDVDLDASDAAGEAVLRPSALKAVGRW